MELLEEKDRVLGLGLAWEDGEETATFAVLPQGFITESYLTGKGSGIVQSLGEISSLNIKKHVKIHGLAAAYLHV